MRVGSDLSGTRRFKEPDLHVTVDARMTMDFVRRFLNGAMMAHLLRLGCAVVRKEVGSRDRHDR
ncbi:hypothetical protein RB2654_09599 [Rhodobacterales bacterium HTCC2654]|uniref:Uncharacterized protein n=1 Tax=Maritimibacter alkaliphilus HTCC2654 TaxID=314271 RepID=A3VEH6_9RHOB|nr:hypothetical protein RB2654_09599 [Rhodobacterales bacterium HTCC2654] [Maritimibacter alkaliphilus HTCC2654]